MTLFYLYLRHFVIPGPDSSLTTYSVLLTAFFLGLGGIMIWNGFQTAHRIAGVHIRLMQTFDKVADGESQVKLRFRASDKLESVEDAFNLMMESLEKTESQEEVEEASDEV